MNEVVVRPPRTAEVVADSPERRVEILADHEALNATWSRFGPFRDGADLHVHRHHADVFYVLEGEFTLRLGVDDEQLTVGAGTLLHVPPLVVHGFRNASDRDVAYLNLHAPGMRFADYLRALRDGREFSYDQHDPPADGGGPVSGLVIGSGDGVLADDDAITVARVRLEPGETLPPAARFVYVLGGSAGVGGTAAGSDTWAQAPANEPVEAGELGAWLLDIRVPR